MSQEGNSVRQVLLFSYTIKPRYPAACLELQLNVPDESRSLRLFGSQQTSSREYPVGVAWQSLQLSRLVFGS